MRSRGETVVARADTEVNDLDINKAIEESERKIEQKLLNRKIIHAIPLLHKIDGQKVLGKLQGMKGVKIEVETLFVTCLEQHLRDQITAIESVGVEVDDVMVSPLAGSFVTLSKTQKIAGCVLANIGSETVSVVVFENNIPISFKVFPIGSTDITNDIALGLKISLEEAEQIKLGAITNADYPRKKLEEIVVARLSDIFELIESHLKNIGKNRMLPAGIILTGGGSGIATIEDLARASLKLPSKIATLQVGEMPHGQGQGFIKDASWAVAYGLCIWGLTTEEESLGITFAKRTGGSILSWMKQFLP
ncbi:pilus assembly protein PilM, partial [Patescibacteria group bacterium]|nr:pilus assembly protein PilM [Patescibacteria group bacterium]